VKFECVRDLEDVVVGAHYLVCWWVFEAFAELERTDFINLFLAHGTYLRESQLAVLASDQSSHQVLAKQGFP